MDTTKFASSLFESQLDGIGLLFGIDMKVGGTAGERLASLGEAAKSNKTLQSSLFDFFENPIHYASRFDSGGTGSAMGAVVRTLLAASVRGAIHSYGQMGAPKKQHWMPVTYLKPFGTKLSESKSNRKLSIPGVAFADGFTMSFDTEDSSFIHDKVNDLGFYEDGAEQFFCIIEGLYAQGRTRRSQAIDHTLVALFFFVQSVRNPRYGQRFVHSTLSAIVDAILANMDAVGPEMQTRFLKTAVQMPFTPYVPPFVDRSGDVRIYSLPIEPKLIFVMSTGPLSNRDWEQSPKRYREAVIRQAVRRGSNLFGIQKSGLIETLSNLKD